MVSWASVCCSAGRWGILQMVFLQIWPFKAGLYPSLFLCWFGWGEALGCAAVPAASTAPAQTALPTARAWLLPLKLEERQAFIWEQTENSACSSQLLLSEQNHLGIREESEQHPPARPLGACQALCVSRGIMQEECLLWKIFVTCSFQLFSLLYFILLRKEKADTFLWGWCLQHCSG